MPPANTPGNFWRRVDRSGGPDACWPFDHPDADGYGRIRFVRVKPKGKIKAHRLAWILTHGATDAQVLHTCDNPPCCNPAHLYEGNPQRNAQDRENRGRGGSNVGENRRRYTATNYEVAKRLYGELGSYSEVSRRTGISISHVWRIVRGDV